MGKREELPGESRFAFLLFGIPLHPESVINKKKRESHIYVQENSGS